MRARPGRSSAASVRPAAAIYTPRMLEVLEADFRRLPGLLGTASAPPAPVVELVPAPAAQPDAVQLGLF